MARCSERAHDQEPTPLEKSVDEVINKLQTPDSCEQFAVNVEKRAPARAQLARVRAVVLRAAAHGAGTAVEREALEAVYAYESAMSSRKGRRFHASRTWQMIERHGIIPAVERIVARSTASSGYSTLVERGFKDKAFEAVVLRHPEAFSEKAVESARKRMGAPGQP